MEPHVGDSIWCDYVAIHNLAAINFPLIISLSWIYKGQNNNPSAGHVIKNNTNNGKSLWPLEKCWHWRLLPLFPQAYRKGESKKTYLKFPHVFIAKEQHNSLQNKICFLFAIKNEYILKRGYLNRNVFA